VKICPRRPRRPQYGDSCAPSSPMVSNAREALEQDIDVELRSDCNHLLERRTIVQQLRISDSRHHVSTIPRTLKATFRDRYVCCTTGFKIEPPNARACVCLVTDLLTYQPARRRCSLQAAASRDLILNNICSEPRWSID
jgi:hypothetical protein